MTQHFQDPAAVVAWLRERVTGQLQADSRSVQVGDGFVAWPGGVTDGRRYVDEALRAGAGAVLVEADGVQQWGPWDDRVASLPQLKARAGDVAKGFYGQPMNAMDVVAITGTNGKTSTAWWLAQLLCAVNRPSAVVGTLGLGTPEGELGRWTWTPTGLTTPDPVLLHRQCAQWLGMGVKACAIEASSIGLVEGRLNGAHLRVAVFTNFTQDHLDFHGDMASYWQAKSSLFDWPTLESAVLNVDDPKGVALAGAWAHRLADVWTVSVDAQRPVPARLQAQAVQAHADGQRLTLIEHDDQGAPVGRWTVDCPLVGLYNVSNLLCVLGAVRALGVPMDTAVAACALLTPVPGRLEPVRTGARAEPLVLVDYAHTPDAVAHVLQALRALAQQRGGVLWAVLGCGGERDRSKRPLMAAAAEQHADRVVLTSDNPRGELPQAILQDMVKGLSEPGRAAVEVDRARAIAWAVEAAQAKDVIVVAGKGHETHQEVAGVRHPFSDAREALAALQRRAQLAGATA